MKEIWKTLLGCVLLSGNTSMSLLGLPFNSRLSQEATGTENQPSPRLYVRIYNLADVPAGTLNRAIREADRLFQRAGIDLEWVECTIPSHDAIKTQECEQPAGPLMLRVEILPRMGKAKSAGEESFFGVAEPYHQGGVEAALFYEHIDTYARSGEASQSVVLGHILAHEVGHLLLWSKSHSPKGIMKSSWAKQDLPAITQGKLAFSSEEAQSMKDNLLSRQMHDQMIVISSGSVR